MSVFAAAWSTMARLDLLADDGRLEVWRRTVHTRRADDARQGIRSVQA
jgi:hypothetical protein